MDFRVLGPLEVWLGTSSLALPARERTLLAALLLGEGRVVSVDKLVSCLWGNHSPPSALSSLQAYVSRLRARLRSYPDPPIIRTWPHGYQLELGTNGFDLADFRSHVEVARRSRAADDLAGAARSYAQALALRRGEPLQDLQSSYLLQTYAASIEEGYLAVQEEHIDVRLALGEHRLLIGELEVLVARWPLRERFVTQLAIALQRNGRTVEALTTVGATRRRMAEEYGLDPSAELTRLELDLLRSAVSEPGQALQPFHVEIGGAGASLSPGDLLGLLQWVQVSGRRLRLVLDEDAS